MKLKRRRKRKRRKKRTTTTTKGFKDQADAATMIAKVALGRAVRMSKLRAAVGGFRWPDPSRTDHEFAKLPVSAATAADNGKGGGGAAAAKAISGESGGGGKGSVGKGSAPARLGTLVALGAFGGEKRQPPRALPSLPETSPERKLKLPAREETLEVSSWVSSSQRPSSKDSSDESMASRLARMRQDRADQRSHRPTARSPEVGAIAIASSPSSPP